MKPLDWPLAPLPPWTPTLLLGDIVVFALLLSMMMRQRRLAVRQAGNGDGQAFHQQKAGCYLKIIQFSAGITVIPYLLWLTGIYLIPGSIHYATPLPIFLGTMIWTPLLVWLTPLAAVFVELQGRSRRGGSR